MRPVFTRPHGIVHDLLLSANHNFTSNQLRPPTDLFRPNMPRLPAAESPASFDVEEPIPMAAEILDDAPRLRVVLRAHVMPPPDDVANAAGLNVPRGSQQRISAQVSFIRQASNKIHSSHQIRTLGT